MMLSFQRVLDVPREVVWPYISEPELMCRWSKAPIRALLPGEGGRMDAVGALRSVRVQRPGGSDRLLEVIQRSRPPERLVYRVLDHPLLSAHRGELSLSEGPRTTLRWQVDFHFALPGLAQLAARTLRPQLEASLDLLQRAAQARPYPRPPEPVRALEDPASDALWDEAQRILEVQRALAARLAQADSPYRWFSQIYVHVTERQLEWARSGQVEHIAWVLRLIPSFHRYYVENLERRLGERKGWPEAQWQKAFEVMNAKDPARALYGGLLYGVRAHIEEDLPRALAEVHHAHYRGRADHARFRADFLLMGDIFKRSTDAMMKELPRRFVPWYYRAASSMPQALKDMMNQRRFYDVAKARREAFERGGRLAALLERA